MLQKVLTKFLDVEYRAPVLNLSFSLTARFTTAPQRPGSLSIAYPRTFCSGGMLGSFPGHFPKGSFNRSSDYVGLILTMRNPIPHQESARTT
jgi:hypothetical protein